MFWKRVNIVAAGMATFLLLSQIAHGDWKRDAYDLPNAVMFLAAIGGFSYVIAALYVTAEKLLKRLFSKD